MHACGNFIHLDQTETKAGRDEKDPGKLMRDNQWLGCHLQKLNSLRKGMEIDRERMRVDDYYQIL